MNSQQPHIVFAGGGTAGHLFPGLAVAAELAARDNPPRITFIGSGKPLEMRLVAKAGFDYLPFPCAALPRGVRGVLKFLGQNIAGYRAARQFLQKERVNVVVGLGGYVSVPTCRAAVKLGIPLALLEQNAIPGKATRWLARRAELVCIAFEEARKHLNCPGQIRRTGNPIRAGFRRRKKAVSANRSARRGLKRRLLVLGGSGGARSLNEFVPKALYKLREQLANWQIADWQIVHQTGPCEAAATSDLYGKLAIEATVVPFVQNLSQVLRRTDVAVCRAGGATLSELAATGVPAVLIPYPHAADNHQRHNAEVFVAAKAAKMVDEREIETRLDDALVAELHEMLSDVLVRQSMSEAMLELAQPDAAWQVATMVSELASGTMSRNVA